MNLKAKWAVVLLSLAPCLTGMARAISIHDFSRLNNDDEAAYIALLVEGTAKMLKAIGQPEQANKAIALFKNSTQGGGVAQLASNLRTVDALNKRNAINPNNRAPEYQVEDAVEITFKNAGILVSTSYLLSIGKDFSPAGPPRPQNVFP